MLKNVKSLCKIQATIYHKKLVEISKALNVY